MFSDQRAEVELQPALVWFSCSLAAEFQRWYIQHFWGSTMNWTSNDFLAFIRKHGEFFFEECHESISFSYTPRKLTCIWNNNIFIGIYIFKRLFFPFLCFLGCGYPIACDIHPIITEVHCDFLLHRRWAPQNLQPATNVAWRGRFWFLEISEAEWRKYGVSPLVCWPWGIWGISICMSPTT